jgi:ParB family chromosome partitioning protein
MPDLNNRELLAVVKEIEIASITRGNYRRLDRGKVEELAASIRQDHLINPITLVEDGPGFALLAGEHRLEACITLGWKTILARVFPASLSKIDRMAMSLTENLHRSNGDPLELAAQVEKFKAEMQGTSRDVARRLGKSESYISKLLKRLEFDEHLRKLGTEEKLSWRAVDALAEIEDSQQRRAATKEAVERSMTAEQVEQICKEYRKPKNAVRKLVKRFASGVTVTVHVPGGLSATDAAKTFDAFAKEAEKCAAQQLDLKDFLTLLSLSRVGGRA